jgi:ABC-2 type transport system permease protein
VVAHVRGLSADSSSLPANGGAAFPTLVRLRATLFLGAFRGSGGRGTSRAFVASAFALLVVGTAIACVGVLSLSGAPRGVVSAVTVLSGSALTLGFALAPLVIGTADPLDPRRFALFDIPARPLAGMLAVAGLLSAPVLAVTALAICTAVAWCAHGASAIGASAGAVLGVLTCAMLARVSGSLRALLLHERRSRELIGLFVVGILVVVVPVGVFLASLQWNGDVPSQLATAADVLADTPFGAAWAIPARGAQGTGAVWFSLVVAVVTLAALVAAWLWAVARTLTTIARPASVRERGGLGWFSLTPGTPGGAIAGRSLVYGLRDRRYVMNLVILPVAAVLAMAPLLVVGVPFSTVILVPVPLLALFLGWLPHNDVAYDSTAVWLHIASGVRGLSDRVGRLVPVMLIGIPTLAVTIPLVISLHGRWAMLPALVGVCAALFLGGMGLSSIASVVAPYPVSGPDQSPFQQPERVGASAAVSQAAVLLGALLVAAPALWWGWLAATDDIGYAVGALWGGIGLGVIVLAGGVAIGAHEFERRGTRIMEFAESA